MSEFDKLAGDAEQYAKDHPDQVHQAEQDAEHAVDGKQGGDDGSGQGQAAQQQPGAQGTSQQGQDQQGQNQQGQDQ